VSALSAQLTAGYGRADGRTKLFYIVQFANAFQGVEIVQTLSAQLSCFNPSPHQLQRRPQARVFLIRHWAADPQRPLA
jgi:hypothetical protein